MIEPGSPWVMRSGRGEPRLRLLCIPYAGGGASAFRGWSEHLPAQVEVCALQPPGRETRLKERPISRLPELIELLVAETRAYRACDYALFGHSLGGLTAFELTRALRRRGEQLPLHLFASACGAPQLAEAGRSLSNLSDVELLAQVRRFAGTPRAVLESAELIELVLPALRADFALREGYVCAEEPPLALPITAFGGGDDADVPRESLAAWRSQTCAAFALHQLPGGHFFFRSAAPAFFAALGTALAALLENARPARSAVSDLETRAGAREPNPQDRHGSPYV